MKSFVVLCLLLIVSVSYANVIQSESVDDSAQEVNVDNGKEMASNELQDQACGGNDGTGGGGDGGEEGGF